MWGILAAENTSVDLLFQHPRLFSTVTTLHLPHHAKKSRPDNERRNGLTFFPVKGFLDTGATFDADLNLVVQVIMGVTLQIRQP